ncbi:response regulator [Pseudodesulfovibrio piezophilus]|uniref:histidine kinase n=1 Tax=Pseudodesulfovibrio piezophilus (strain DSM 21447 / JCM 15486 / C1TLV30) TaxID=1322246 RepID=M1WJM8_PSEP2|nr:response regulator [Pseudodesulfovibrio piezophilus]CCH48171.1 Multi-sensor signal transduction histidine kinase [Pseudodesulfovibrio piezophilus C1TLV30]
MTQLPILLVDDEDGIRKVLSISLEDSGYTVDTASDVESALSLFHAKHHPLVITDIKMPGRSGIDLLRALKQIAPETEVIMITGHGDVELAVQSLKNDAFDFIMKPINDEVLTFALQRAQERILMRRSLQEYTCNLEELIERKSTQLIEAERRAAACQLFEGLTSSLSAFASNLDNLSVFNQMPMFVSIHNRDKGVVTVNQHYRKRLGDLAGKKSWSMYVGLEDGEKQCPVAKTIETGQAQRESRVVRCVNGNDHAVIVDTVPIMSTDDGVELVLEFMVDLLEAETLREELRTTRHKYEQLFNQSPCFISVQDRDFHINSANARYIENFGDFTGRPCYESLMHRQRPCIECPLQQTFVDGQTHQLETVVTNRKGEKVNILIWSSPIRDASGEMIEAVEMITDITQIRKLQDRLTSLGLLLGSTAHGIKGLLTGIDGAIYRLGSGLEKRNFDRMGDGFNDLQTLTDRMKQTVLDILYYAKKRELNWKEMDAARFTMDLYASFAAKAKKMGVILDLDMGAVLGSFKVDKSILASALGNIIENGIDACAAHPEGKGRVTLKVYADLGQIAFRVTDNGIGMEREVREKLFTLFFSSKGSSGTGIGLFIAHEIVTQHGGSITVDSEPGKGAVFTVCVPRELSVGG